MRYPMTGEKAKTIWWLYHEEGWTAKMIAKEYGMSPELVYKVAAGNTKWVMYDGRTREEAAREQLDQDALDREMMALGRDARELWGKRFYYGQSAGEFLSFWEGLTEEQLSWVKERYPRVMRGLWDMILMALEKEPMPPRAAAHSLERRG